MDRGDGMRIMITGDTGLVGSNLKDKLRDDHEILGLSRRGGYDMRDKELVRSAVEEFKPEVVYHLAANAAESRGEISPIDMTERNLNIFLNVLTPAINNGLKKFIYTSSVAVYGEAEVPYREDDICKPKDVYGVNKLACEQMLKIMSKRYDFQYTIFRPHNIYGPNQDMSSPYKNVVALFMRNIMEGKTCIIFGEGKMRRAFSYVDDVVGVMINALNGMKNETINLGSSIEYDLATLLERIEKVAGKKAKVKHLPARPNEIYLFLPCHRKLHMVTEYRETSLDDGLQKTWDFINLPDIIKEEDEIHTKKR